MSEAVSIAGRAPWLRDKNLQRLLAVLSGHGDKARIAGGAVRNALMNQPVADVDIATTTQPEETMRRAESAGFKSIPTGIAHGTITVVAAGKPFEVTTLRADIETDGRRAKVSFGRDWKTDAERRDFTINALYAEADGTVVDLVGGIADIEVRRLRFIGDAEARIREDYLRILRFFRFFAWYGDGRPDAEGLKACARLKEGLDRLSAERVWSELKKLLSAPDPSRALLWMRQAGVLSRVLPESEKWGIDAIHSLAGTERALDWKADPLLRLEAIVPPDAARMNKLAERLRLSSAEANRLQRWALTPPVEPTDTEGMLARTLYHGDQQGITDRLRLSLAAARGRAMQDDGALEQAGGFSRLLGYAEKWRRPVFPVKGADLTALGAAPGPELGALLKKLETEWIGSGFSLGRDALLERAAQAI
ncbi:CCA tRNA nucleotidyltransferase [Mesorhizobium sp. SP-1A]|uniref:CCA tRNA nucleotidyltransferase n=1 Tax=Mesorhizobium sp. SP-1A TaxID=3077840 RepID=UPI0028F7449C|nr:CCA tRNA nucleotidyltransferase [Mesorhizobium sp. SP-1A]